MSLQNEKVITDADEIFFIDQEDGDDDTDDDNESVSRSDDFCANFKKTTIFDQFKDIFVTGLFFSYNADVKTIEREVEQTLDLDYTVTFEPGQTDGLNQINEKH